MGSVSRINELIDNDNERFQRNHSMTMSMKGYGVRDEKLSEAFVDDKANYLVSVFESPSSKPLYCDAVRYLTRSYLEEQIKVAYDKGRVPAKLFTHIIHKKLVSIGVYA